MKISLFNSLCYTAGWFWCVCMGIQGQHILAALGAAFLILVQLYFVKTNNHAMYMQDLLLVVFSIPLGISLEMIFMQTNLIKYVNANSMLPPIWIVCLYPLFSLQLNHSLNFIKTSYLVSFGLGFLGAPFSYYAGLSLGAATFLHPLLHTAILIGFGWGLFLIVLTKIANAIENAIKTKE